MGYNTTPLVLRTGVRATWLPGDPGDRFWYRVTTENGVEVLLVDPSKATRPACDLPACKAAERETGGGGRVGGPGAAAPRADTSPDGKRTAFVRDWNLWVRDIASGRETQLTKDGIKDFGYATDNAGWQRSDRPILRWSPDSKKIATFQQDQRGVGEMYLVDTQVGHPALQAWKYPLPGDATVTMITRVVVDVDSGKMVRLQLPPDQHRSTLCDDVACRGEWGDVQGAGWPKMAFVSTSRDHCTSNCGGRPLSGQCEVLKKVRRSSVGQRASTGNFARLERVIWFSARQLGQLYCDLQTGARSGDRPARQRHAAPARGREEPHALFPRGRARKGTRPVLPPLLPDRHGRQEPASADAGRCGS